MESRRADADIISAATNEELNRLKKLLAKYDDGRGLATTVKNVKNVNGAGAIHCAARGGKLNVLKYLIEELGLDVNTKDERGGSPLLQATLGGNMNTVEYLLVKGADPETSDTKGYMPLHAAAEKGYTEIVTKLLSRGVNVNAASEIGTSLVMAANFGQLEALQILLDHNANPNLSPGCSFTPLAGSIVSGYLQCVEPLLEAGADPDGGSYGETPLIAAADDGLTQIIKRLIQAGANSDITNNIMLSDLCRPIFTLYLQAQYPDDTLCCIYYTNDGFTPIEIAALNGYSNVVEVLFPVTSRIPGYVDWSIGGVIAHVQSDQAKEQRELKAKEKLHEAKLSGTDAFNKKDYYKAKFSYSKANEIDPNDAIILSNRSMCWARMYEGAKALVDASACIVRRPYWPKGYYMGGVAHSLLKRYNKAEKAFLAGLEWSPNSQELKDAYRFNSTTP
ncbi:26S proteasome non-ATPase regulatory subunit 10-like [Papaver somniferum]|uniref:26S proteasome non-ATPase regulatory subunit 10-like n=1 Tax=Papaver somniferum TaxID=3469 RepID=UPI000E6FF761|nr:26S proteasome non-ATPase regulatory subunit 10-like [Papaver somniferum]